MQKKKRKECKDTEIGRKDWERRFWCKASGTMVSMKRVILPTHLGPLQCRLQTSYRWQYMCVMSAPGDPRRAARLWPRPGYRATGMA